MGSEIILNRVHSTISGRIAVDAKTCIRQRVLDLFEDHYAHVFAFARRSLSPNEAEDVAQEVFTRLLEVSNLHEREIVVSYLLKIANNIIRQRYLRNERFSRFLAYTGATTRFASEPDAHDSELPRMRMTSLRPEEHDAMRLIVCEGLSYERAARALNVPVSTVNNWKYRAIRKLQGGD